MKNPTLFISREKILETAERLKGDPCSIRIGFDEYEFLISPQIMYRFGDDKDFWVGHEKALAPGRHPNKKVWVIDIEDVPPCVHKKVLPQGGGWMCHGCLIEMVPTGFKPKEEDNGKG